MINLGDTVTIGRGGVPMVILEIQPNGVIVCGWLFGGERNVAAFDGFHLLLWRKGRLN